jgi:hypothetical protein
MISGNKELLYWYHQEQWYEYDAATDRYSVKSDAPERVKKSFEMWKKLNPKHAA